MRNVHLTRTSLCRALNMPTEQERPGMFAPSHRQPQVRQQARVHIGPFRSHPVPSHARAPSTIPQAPQAQRIIDSSVQNQDLTTACDADYGDYWTPNDLAMIRAAIITPRHGFTTFHPENQLDEGYTEPSEIVLRKDSAPVSTVPLSPVDQHSQSSGPYHQEPSHVGESSEDSVSGTTHHANDASIGGHQTPASTELVNLNHETLDIDEPHYVPTVQKIPAFRPLSLHLPAGSSLHDEIFGQVSNSDHGI
jgi:hypothetical protein